MSKATFVYMATCLPTVCTHSRIPRFAWSDVNLWAEDLPERALIVISGQDDLIHVNEVSVRRGRSRPDVEYAYYNIRFIQVRIAGRILAARPIPPRPHCHNTTPPCTLHRCA